MLTLLFLTLPAHAIPKTGLYGLDPAKALQGTRPAVERKIRTARRHPPGIDTSCLPKRIRDTISEIERRWGRVTIISAYRRGATIRNTGHRSKHADCLAADFNPAPGTKAQVYRWLKESWDGGLGIYNRKPFHHLHIDVGPRYRWVN